MKLPKIARAFALGPLPHIAGLATSLLVLAAVATASQFYQSTLSDQFVVPKSIDHVKFAETFSTQDAPLLLKIAASKAINGDGDVVVAYDSSQICYDMVNQSLDIPNNGTIWRARFANNSKTIQFSEKMDVANIRKLCLSKSLRNTDIFVSDQELAYFNAYASSKVRKDYIALTR